jgi:hypothetical protein
VSGSKRHRLQLSGCLVAAALSFLAAITQVNPAVRWAETSVREIAASMTGVYVSLRVINAALSAAQEIEVGASVGAQATVPPLKVLEPVDDTVERVSDVVFAVAVGAAVATVGLTPVTALGALVLGGGLLVLAAGLVWPNLPVGIADLARRAVRLGGAVAVVLPLVVVAGLELGDRMTAGAQEDAYAVLNGVAQEAQVLIGQDTPDPGAIVEEPEGRFLGRLLDSVSSAGETLQAYTQAAGVFRSEATALFEATLILIGVFVLQSIVLPVLLFWGLLALVRRSMD